MRRIPSTGRAVTGRAVGVLAAGLLVAAMAACGSSDDAADATATATNAAGTATGAATGAAKTTTPSAAPGGAEPGDAVGGEGSDPGVGRTGSAELLALTIDGDAMSTDFPDTRCEWDTDDGHPQLEFEAQNRAADTELEVEIVMSDPPRLDDFQFETRDNEWEASDSDRGQASITVDGDTYRVDSPVTDDDDRPARMVAEFTCPR